VGMGCHCGLIDRLGNYCLLDNDWKDYSVRLEMPEFYLLNV